MHLHIYRREYREATEAIAGAIGAVALALLITLALGEIFIGAEHSVLIGWPR